MKINFDLKYDKTRNKKCLVADGPESVHIQGPEEGSPGDTLTLECSTADSNPPVDVWWVVDGRAVQVQHLLIIFSTMYSYLLWDFYFPHAVYQV